jgi:hypothetical protein
VNLSSAIAAGGSSAVSDLTTNLGALALWLIPAGVVVGIFGIVIRKARLH